MRLLNARSKKIQRLQNALKRESYPRLQMALLVSITGAIGFIASYALLSGGLSVMWIRYLAAFGIAYLVFLGLLWLWIHLSTKDHTGVDLFQLVPTSGSGDKSASVFYGKGGSFDGGGASGNFDNAAVPPSPISLDSDSGTIIGDTVGATFEAEELAIPLIAILFLIGLLLSSLWVIYTAPLLFAELLVDGVLAVNLYRRLRRPQSCHWLETAIKRTAIPFALTAVVLACTGAGLQHYVPEARTMAEALFQLRVH
jgi:hypothetical protein